MGDINQTDSQEFEFISVKEEPLDEDVLPNQESEFVPLKKEPQIEEELPHQRHYPRRQLHTVGRNLKNLSSTFEEREIMCPTCHFTFMGRKGLQQHIISAHQFQAVSPTHNSSMSLAATSSASKQGSSTLGCWPLASGTADVGIGPPEAAAAAAAADTLGRTADAPRSLMATGLANTRSPLGGNVMRKGLKTHISTTFGGLLDHTLNKLPERSLSPRLRTPPLNLIQELSTQQPSQLMSEISTMCSGPLYNTKLAKRLRRQVGAKLMAKGILMLQTDGVANSLPFACLYCECRFEKQTNRNIHVAKVHNGESVSSKPNHNSQYIIPAETEDDPDDPSGGEDPDNNCDINFATPQVALTHCSHHESPLPAPSIPPAPAPMKSRNNSDSATDVVHTVTTSSPSEEDIRLQAMAALQELGVQRRRRGSQGTSLVTHPH